MQHASMQHAPVQHALLFFKSTRNTKYYATLTDMLSFIAQSNDVIFRTPRQFLWAG